MKKYLSIFLMLLVLVTSSLSVLASSIQTENEIKTFKVYDGAGNLLDTVNSKDDLSLYGIDQNQRADLLVAKFTKTYGEIGMVHELALGLTKLTLWLAETKVQVPYCPTESLVYIYSKDRNLYNPYPPNSYEGAMWPQNNFIIIVEEK